jgi:hypothetical protein
VIHVLHVSPERFRMSPQIGVHCEMEWDQLAAYLARPSIGEAKDEAGAWSPALYRDNVRRKSSLVAIDAIVLDFDESGVDEVADVLGRYTVIVHETFSSTNDNPRCRAVVQLAEPIDAATYEAMHALARAHMRDVGLPADEGAKDASRLSYAPVRRQGAGYRFRALDGELLDARRVLAAQPPPPPRPVPRPPSPEHRDRYIEGALRSAATAVADANEGIRHYTLCKEAFGLARLGLATHEIERALLPAFVAAAGERREAEGRRTIADAVRARKGAA